MNSTIEQLLNAALALPDEDRLEVAEALIVSLQPSDQPPFDDSWREIIQRRSADLLSGTVTPIAWDEVKRRARENTRR
jgi:putative addiction module component (TIGR02574 family)